MMTYALIFQYHITARVEQCSVNNGNCERCLAAGCSMTGSKGACVSSCFSDATCWSAVHSDPTAVCANRQASVDKASLCASQSSCSACLDSQCQWGGPMGAVASCMPSCGLAQQCSFVDRCPTADNVCDAITTCEACIDARCSVVGLHGLSCVQECPTDVPCFNPDAAKTSKTICNERTALVDKTALCKSKSSCSDCLDAQCSWNSLGSKGNECITSCGFFPCELTTVCKDQGGSTVMKVMGGERSQAFETAASGSLVLALLLSGLW